MMVRLTRTVRFSVGGGASRGDRQGRNGCGGWPRSEGLSRYYELDVACLGEPDARTSYLADVKAIDESVREAALPVLEEACAGAGGEPAALLARMVERVSAVCPARVEWVRWRLTPQHAMTMEASTMSSVLLSQRFEFAASHRLHNPAMSDEENRRIYGKCNHPSGHGHNYIVEPVVEASADARGAAFGLGELERIVDSAVLDRFDHKHLNLDTEEFGERGVNPSVENIARVCFELLEAPIEKAGARLREVTVWETDRTRATYPA